MDKKLARKNLLNITIKNKEQRDVELSNKLNVFLKPYKLIGMYMPFKNEPIINLNEKYVICYPKVEGKQMNYYIPHNGFTISSYGIMEPNIENNQVVFPDVIIAPCVGYHNNYRLGYGGGYFDRYLSVNNVKCIGIAYFETKLEMLDVETFDIELDEIIVN